eukprot:CAMPEP_0119142138 /NCGR_PEP_ID=MMETSP1310-20130426/32131_1 /TAXON_ID=464262 /ORGANISM="Genus nov. species nov., Strain RCC2339" /LENGTH=126 /DNA_ID=CAMNT_0007133651 /DNA_START=93 /DNA_END=470 /DNA_ORIENTATION=-
MARAVVVTAAQFSTYDVSKRTLMQRGGLRDSLGTHLLASMVSGVAVVLAASPVDVLKSRVMNSSLSSSGHQTGSGYNGVWDCVRKTIRDEGVKGFYRGVGPYYVRVAPHVTTMFVMYEYIDRGVEW